MHEKTFSGKALPEPLGELAALPDPLELRKGKEGW